MRKVFFISYTNIKNGQTLHPAFSAYLDAAKKLPDNYQFYFATCDCECSNIHSAPKWLSFFNCIFLRVTGRLRIPYYYTRTLSESLFDIYYSFVLRREKEEYNLITAMYSPLSTKVAKKAGAKISLIAANHDDNLYYKVVKEEKAKYNYKFRDVYDSSFRNSFYRRMLKNVTDVVSSTKLVLDFFPAHYNKTLIGSSTRRIEYESKSNYKITENTYIIGYIGHTVFLKGVHVLAQAIAASNIKDRIVLKICGNIDSNVKSIIDGTGIKIDYLGYIREEEKNDFYNSCDIIIVPSIYDAGPTTVLEAIECEVPLIISSGCGYIELLESYKSECVFETRNVFDLAKKIEDSYKNYSRYVEIVKTLKLNLGKNQQADRPTVYNYIKQFAQ